MSGYTAWILSTPPRREGDVWIASLFIGSALPESEVIDRHFLEGVVLHTFARDMQHGIAGCDARAQNEGPTRIMGCAKRRIPIERDEYIKPLNVRL